MHGNPDRRSECRGQRRGATLLELMAVTLILLMVTAMTVPVVAPAVKGRRIREGARMVSSFISAARNRAIETGRPAGVWLQRTAGLAEVCEHLYMCELPPPYSGDFLDSQAELVCVDQNGDPYIGRGIPGSRDYWNLIIPRTRTTFLTDAWSVPDPTQQTIVQEGDELELEGYDARFRLSVCEGVTINNSVISGTTWWYFLKGRNTTASGPLGAYNANFVWENGRWKHRFFNGQKNFGGQDAHISTTATPGNFDRRGIRYKIHRQPQRLQAGSIRLPETVVIDLNFSSLTADARLPGTPFHPKNGARSPAPASANLFGMYWGDPLYPEDNSPIVIVFAPGGHVERIYCHMRDSAGRWTWASHDAAGPVYLLVGDREHITPGQYYLDGNQNEDQNVEIQLGKNWLNLDALWVRITANTGTVSTSLVDDVAYEASDSNAGFVAADPCNLHQTRLNKAANARAIGGR